MKIKDGTSVREYGMAVLPLASGEDLNLKIRSVGCEIDVLTSSAEWFVSPPVQVMRGRNGQVLRDPDGQPVTITDRNAPAYLAKRDEIELLRKVAYIYHGLVEKKDGGDIEWDTDRDQHTEGSLQFFRSIRDELIEAGFSQGTIVNLFAQINELSVPTHKEVEAAEKSFQDG